MKKIAVVAIHGVGLPSPGSILKDVQEGLSHVANYGRRADVLVDGITYPRVEFKNSPVSEIIEVNWSDIKRASQNFAGFFRHLIFIVIAMMTISNSNLENSQSKLEFAQRYKFLFETVLVWCIYPSIFMLFWLSFDSNQKKCLTILVLSITLVILVTYLGRFSKRFYAGYLWIVLSIIFVVLHISNLVSIELILQLSTYAYVVGQALTVFVLLVSIAEVLVNRELSHTSDYLVTRLSFLYVPMLCMSALGAVVWATSLLVASEYGGDTDGYKIWERAYLETLGYDIALMEYVFAAVVFSIGVLCLAGIVNYLYVRHIKTRDKPHCHSHVDFSGSIAQNWISKLAHFIPVILLFLALYYIYAILFTKSNPDTSVLTVYTWSAMRILPFVPIIVGPMAILLDVFGDVIFYILPESSKISALSKTRSRLEAALELARSENNEIVVLSHSQGSVVAIDVIGTSEFSDIRLITAGSPISSLYGRFLLSTPNGRSKKYIVPKQWTNIFRLDDYVAGPISNTESIETIGKVDVCCGRGGHIGYWNDRKVANIILKTDVEQNDEAVS